MNVVDTKVIVKPIVAALALVFCASVALAQDSTRPRDPRPARHQQQPPSKSQVTAMAAVAAAPAVQTAAAINYYSNAISVLQYEQAILAMKAANIDLKLIEQVEATLVEIRKVGAAIPAPTRNPFTP